jgi:hypothetical protein
VSTAPRPWGAGGSPTEGGTGPAEGQSAPSSAQSESASSSTAIPSASSSAAIPSASSSAAIPSASSSSASRSASSSTGTQDVREIELEIEATREELNRTLDALQARLSPRRRLQAVMRNARDRGSRIADRGTELARDAADMVKRQPLPFVVATVGVIAIFAARMVIRGRGGWR